jgi:hypothetical protein
MLLKRNLPLLSYLSAYKVFPPHVRRRYLRAYKAHKKHLFRRPIRSLPTYQVSLWSLPTYKVGPCNPWLINDLRAFGIFTLVESALQIGPFCSNKPNFRKSQMNVNNVLTKDYDQMDTWSIRKNKPNSNPIQSQFKPNQSQNKPNTKPNKPNFILSLPALQVGQYMLLICTTLKVLEISIITGYHLEPTRPINHRRLP